MTEQITLQTKDQELIDQILTHLDMTVEQATETAIFTSLQVLQSTIYQGNVKAGWWTNLQTGELKPKGDVTEILAKLALVHSEVSECVEGVRKDLMDDHLPHRKMAEVEAADAIIRLLDTAGHEGWDLAGAIREKLAYNKTRKDHSIEARLSTGGKRA